MSTEALAQCILKLRKAEQIEMVSMTFSCCFYNVIIIQTYLVILSLW